MPIVTFTDSDFEVIPTGEYKVQCTNVEQTEGNFGPQIKLTLEIISGEYEEKSVWAWCGLKGGPKAKLTKWAAAFGIDTSAGASLDTDDLVGKKCIAVVLAKEKEDKSGEYNTVTDLKAPKPRTKAKVEGDAFDDE